MNMDTNTGKKVCECGAHPPGPPRDREVVPYAGEPADMRPYAKFTAPYDTNYTRPTSIWAQQEISRAQGSDRGAHWLLRANREQFGIGSWIANAACAQLAVEEANAARLRGQALQADAT